MGIVIGWIKVQWLALCLVLGYAAIFWWQLADYVNVGSLDFQLGMLALMVVVSSNSNRQKGGLRFAVAAVVAAIITIFLPVKTMLYVTVLLAVFFVVETCVAKIPALSILAIVLVSPICRYVMNVFSFPVRLCLTRWVGGMLSFTGCDSSAEGNIILYNGDEFSVDPACMGMYMLITSLLSGIMVIALQQKKYGRTLKPVVVILFLLFITGCNVLCNLCRIFILVYYKILPDTIMHEVTGIVCFVVYVIVPVVLCAPWVIKKYGKPALKHDARQDITTGCIKWGRHAVVAICCLSAAVVTAHQKKMNSTGKVFDNNGMYAVSALHNGITKMENDSALIYLKPIRGFYSSDHHPMVCWTGSGYEFTKVHAGNIGGKEVYEGILSKGKEKLYTAWWYDNGDHFTIEQWAWRWDMLRGSKPYSLINITAADGYELKRQVEYFIHNRRQVNTSH
ncbi:MAG: exosortase N [Chitinophagaceae bacterium]|nr:exosortase N [Chitinophagaceae bacterium]